MLILISACAQTPPAQFTTMLDKPDGLGPGDPVTRGGATIGQVNQVTANADGSSDVTIQIDGAEAKSVRSGSVLQLGSTGSSPSLELTATDPTASGADPGSFIAGASNQQQTEMLLAARGTPALSARYQNAFGNASPANSGASTQMSNDLMALWQATLAATASASAAVGGIQQPAMTPQQQVDKLRSDGSAVERELMREGRFDDAARVHQQVAQLTANMSATLPQPVPAPSTGASAPH